ncbi:hypothetical protein MferCBS31731_006530 [Microsporum ferrugineum]
MRVSTPKSGAETWPPRPPIAVFIRNLKLLRLDLRPDWPGILPSTLSDSQNNLRRRIQAVEWALFYLFQLWDPELTRNKLQPFFPPLEPLQSSNLRAALFRSLSELTKNGTLGRERILRKAMLEECTGEKFDEILAEFSTIVLRKVVASSREYSTGAPSLSLPASKKGPPSDTHNLLPMIIAYRASLHSMIDQKNELNSTCRDLKQFLHLKSNELANSRRMPKPLASELRNQQQFQESINRSWHGDINWATTILNGDSQAGSEPLLEMDFSQVWSGMKKVEIKGGPGPQAHPDLLADLDDRLSKQKSRLQGWREFKESLDLDSLRVRLQRPDTSERPQTLPQNKCSVTNSPVANVEANQETYSNSADLDESLIVHPEPEISYTPETFSNSKARDDADANQEQATISQEVSAAANFNARESGVVANMSTDDLLAMQLGVLPSSKAGTTELPESNATVNDTSITDDTSGVEENENQLPEDVASGATTLLERTRQSMLFVSSATPRPWKPISDNRRQSQLLFPGDPFETPEKRAENKGNSNKEVSDDDPYSDYVDYDSVFKSRPKVASSPIPFESTQQGSGDENQDEGCSFSELALENSPLGKMQSRPRAQTAIRHPVICTDAAEATG